MACRAPLATPTGVACAPRVTDCPCLARLPALGQVGTARAGDSIETIHGEPFTRSQFASLFEVLPPHGVVRIASSASAHSLGPRSAARQLVLGLSRSIVVSGPPAEAETEASPHGSPQRPAGGRIRDTRWRAASAEARPRRAPDRDGRVPRQLTRSPVNLAPAPSEAPAGVSR